MISTEDMGRLIGRDRFFYHLVWDATPTTVASVLEHGLERERSNYVGFWESRPDHTYLGRLDIVKRIFFRHEDGITGKAFVNDRGYFDWALFAIDLGHLEAQRVNPDEDHFGFYQSTDGVEVSRRFHLPFSPCKWAWDWAEYLGIRPPASLGEWAGAVDLGSDPETTAYSASCGSLCYRGVVPASALRLVKANIPLGEAA